MAELRMSITLEGSAFEEDPDGEVMRIMSRVIDGIRMNHPIACGTLGHTQSLFDINGNRAGSIKVYEDEEL